MQDCVKRGELSALQLETIVYANQRFNGPYLPDGACRGGVCSCRQLSCLHLHAAACNRWAAC